MGEKAGDVVVSAKDAAKDAMQRTKSISREKVDSFSSDQSRSFDGRDVKESLPHDSSRSGGGGMGGSRYFKEEEQEDGENVVGATPQQVLPDVLGRSDGNGHVVKSERERVLEQVLHAKELEQSQEADSHHSFSPQKQIADEEERKRKMEFWEEKRKEAKEDVERANGF